MIQDLQPLCWMEEGKIDAMLENKLPILLLLLVAAMLTGCQPGNVPSTAIQTTPIPSIERTQEEFSPGNINQQPQDSPIMPTEKPETRQVIATVWREAPLVPILMYHRFSPQTGGSTSRYMTDLAEFDQHLIALNEAGFSLVALQDWLRGEIHIPEGRRPLIITMDDLFYADQISLDEDGQPASYSGIGRLWQFSHENPDFGFQVALFFNLGDKGYANQYANGRFTVQEGWRQAQAEAIAWGIENGAIPFNHFYEHPFLDRLSPDEILWQLTENDRALREALALVGKEDLSKSLPNILALPYVVWPVSESGKQILFDYRNPEGAPVAAILEANTSAYPRLNPAPFSTDFDRWHISRSNASAEAVRGIINHFEEIPAAETCHLGLLIGDPIIHAGIISDAILQQVDQSLCPDGYYIVGQQVFHVKEGHLVQYRP